MGQMPGKRFEHDFWSRHNDEYDGTGYAAAEFVGHPFASARE